MWPSAPKSHNEIVSHIKSKQQAMKNGSELMMVVLSKDTLEFLGITSIHRANTTKP